MTSTTTQANVPASVPEKSPENGDRRVVPKPGDPVHENTLARIVLRGDLSTLNPTELVTYYYAMCRTIGADPLTRPFDLIEMPDEKDKKKTRVILYPNSRCASQLRANHQISFEKPEIEEKHGCVIVTIRATLNGRTDFDTGAVPTMKPGGEWVDTGKKYPDGNPKREFRPDGTMTPIDPLAAANAIKKAITQAKRRVTFSLCGLAGLPDQDDAENGTFAGARVIDTEAVLRGEDPRAIESPEGQPEKKAPTVTVDDFRNLATVRDALALLVLGPDATGDQKQALGRERAQTAIGKPIPQTRDEIDQVVAAIKAEIESRGSAVPGAAVREPGSDDAEPADSKPSAPAKGQKSLTL